MKRVLAGLATVVTLLVVVGVAFGRCRGRFATAVPMTVVSERAGLVMYPEAKVKLHGAQIGHVSSIEPLSGGRAALHLAINPDAMDLIPANVSADIASSTVFGSKFVELVPPKNPSSESAKAGQVVEGDHVTVELNTVFEQLTSVLSKVDPAKLNETVGAITKALNGRGEKFGETLTNLNSALAKVNPSLESLNHELAVAPRVLDSYAAAAPDLLTTVREATTVSNTIVDQQDNLDALLVSAIGLADTGTDVLSENKQPLEDVVHLLAPTLDLTKRYGPAITCGLQGLLPLAEGPGTEVPGVMLLVSFFLGRERYRYPMNLPKVAAAGGPQCSGLPTVPFESRPPYVVTDIGANQAQYGNQGILLNSDALKQALFGPIDGPPRNTMQIGMPG